MKVSGAAATGGVEKRAVRYRAPRPPTGVLPTDTYEPSLSQAQFSAEDITSIMQCRGEHNRLGFAYQLAFVRFFNRFPTQEPLEIEEDILAFASVQLSASIQDGWQYGGRLGAPGSR